MEKSQNDIKTWEIFSEKYLRKESRQFSARPMSNQPNTLLTKKRLLGQKSQKIIKRFSCSSEIGNFQDLFDFVMPSEISYFVDSLNMIYKGKKNSH